MTNQEKREKCERLRAAFMKIEAAIRDLRDGDADGERAALNVLATRFALEITKIGGV